MLKKSLIISSIFCLIVLVSSTVFGTNFVNDTKSGLQNMGNGIKNVVQDVTNSAKDVKNDMTNTENNVENKVDNGAKDMEGMTDGYTATRTDATTDATTTNNTLVWVVLAIAGAIIIALVWYYALQTNKDDRNNHE